MGSSSRRSTFVNSSSKIELELNLNLNPPQNTMYVCMLYNSSQELFFKMKKKKLFSINCL